MYLLILLSFIAWGMALIGLCSRRDIDVHSKISWLVVILVFHGIGAILYFLFSSNREPEDLDSTDDIYAPTTCMQCGSEIPAGKDICDNCKWSYKA